MKNYSTKVILAASLLIVGVLLAQTKIDSNQAKFGAPIIPVSVDGEVPSGMVNGVNAVFTLAATPNPPASVHIYLNGLRQNPTAPGGDYTISGNTITFAATNIPQPGVPGGAVADIILVDYRH